MTTMLTHPDEHDTLTDPIADPDGTQVPPFQVDDDARATWAMRKAREAKRRIQEVDRIAAAETERIQQWALDARRQPEADLNFFTGLLTDYARRVRLLDPKRKSISTPYGIVKTTAKAVGWEFDPDTFLAWAKTNAPDLVKTTETVKVADAKKTFLADEATLIVTTAAGEVVPGITLSPSGVSITVTPEP